MVAYLSGRSQLTKPQRALGRLLPARWWAPLKFSGGHTIPRLAWKVPETALDVWAERGGEMVGLRWLPQPEVTWGVWTDSPGTTDAVSPHAWHHASSKPHSKKQGPFSPLYRQQYSASATENLPVTPSQSLHSSGSPFPFP